MGFRFFASESCLKGKLVGNHFEFLHVCCFGIIAGGIIYSSWYSGTNSCAHNTQGWGTNEAAGGGEQ